MARKDSLPQLTQAELYIMKVLWREERLSAREIHDRISEGLGWAYSTTRTTLERMVRKRLVSKKAFHGIRIYEPLISRARGLARMVLEFAGQVLEMRPEPVLSLFAEGDALDREEIKELRALLKAAADKEA